MEATVNDGLSARSAAQLRRREKKETTRKGGEKRTKIRRDRASFRSLNVGNFG